jgi:hypothetical protein
MRPPAAGALLLLAAVAPLISLAACGSAGPAIKATTTTNTTPASQATAPAATASVPTAPATSTPRAPANSTRPAPPLLAAGPRNGAASFKRPGADNSIPDYGHEASPAERQRATTALTIFLHARAGHDWPAVCNYLALSVRRPIEALASHSKAAGRCSYVLAALAHTHVAPAPALDPTTGLAALRIQGATAFALLRGPNNTKYVVPMQEEHGAWKMTQTTPLPYPLAPAATATP